VILKIADRFLVVAARSPIPAPIAAAPALATVHLGLLPAKTLYIGLAG
jgi:hypothetical protein